MGVIKKGKTSYASKAGEKLKHGLIVLAFVVVVAFVAGRNEEVGVPASTLIDAVAHNSIRRASETSNCDEILDAFDVKFNERRRKRQEHYPDYRKDNLGETRIYDLFEPEAVCFDEERFGTKERYSAFGDGPKFVCGVDLIAEKARQQKDGCLVYSVGSYNRIDFEVAVSNFMPGCETHTFDPTLKDAFIGDDYATFHPWGIGLDGQPKSYKGKTWDGKGIESIMTELGHLNRTLDILKIDCEGCEYQAMPVLFEAIAAGRLKVNQIQIELHGLNYPRVERFFHAADNAKMRIFHKERNHWGCDGYECLEYALISEDFLREANGAAACGRTAAAATSSSR